MKFYKFNHIFILTAAVVFGVPSTFAADATTPEETTLAVLKGYLPGTSGLGVLNVVKVSPDSKNKQIQIDLNKTAGYIPLDKERLDALKNDIKAALGSKYKNYTVKLDVVEYDKGKEVKRRSMDDLYLFAPKPVNGPTETTRFVTGLDKPAAPKGLVGANIALWQSHGWYFEPKLNRWEWQRARIFQTVEDLYTQSYVMPFLMPMLTNAGAYVMSPRERDTNRVEIIVDNDGGQSKGHYAETKSGVWKNSDQPGFGYVNPVLKVNENPFRQGTALVADAAASASKAAKATWTADFPEAGKYAVYVSYQTQPNSTEGATYTVNDRAGSHRFKINQKMGGGTWIYLGHFDFSKGTPDKPVVELTTLTDDKGTVVTADAVKIGGGMGNVVRKVGEPKEPIDYDYVGSGYPRFTEAAMYWLQWAGAPDSVYTLSGNVNDYIDDYRSRGEWVNWLAGGSSILPQRQGLNIPVDLSFAFHTDAGTTMNDSIIGTLGIYCTDGRQNGDFYANGTSRLASRDLTNLVMTNIVDDVRKTFEPNWTRRGMWDGSYYEARVPEVPAMLLELLSHQNFADMKYGLDPAFRFVVSRAVYKGMLKFLSQRDGRPYVVQPLPVRAFAITATSGNKYELTWAETVDSIEPTANPTYYIIEERIGDGAFKPLARSEQPRYTVEIKDDAIHSYRIIAANDGGVSFPGEVLALCHRPDAPTVNIVNGFTRVSAPDWFDSGEIAGFYDTRDPGVPYIEDISYIGPMFEFRRDIPWMDDDAAGFGASRANYEDRVVAGNTFDFVYTHGQAVAQAGYGFVSTSVEAFIDAPVAGQPMLVDLILGKQKEIERGRGVYGSAYKTFPAPLQDKIRQFTAAGGSIFVSGAFVATDLWDNRYSSPEVAAADQKFATEVLGYHWRVGQATVEGGAYQVQTRFKDFTDGEYQFASQLNDECYAAESPDSFYPADDKKGATFMRYTENNLIAGTAFDNSAYRTVVIGFPFETITDADKRASLMSQVLSFLTDSNPIATMRKQVNTENSKTASTPVRNKTRVAGNRAIEVRPAKSAKGKQINVNPATTQSVQGTLK